MKFFAFLFLCVSFLIIERTLGSSPQNPPHAKKIFKYTYDDAGNRIQRIYLYATPCNSVDPDVPNDPNCNSRKRDTTLRDSLFAIAQTIEIIRPDSSTEKINNDGSPELKNLYPNPTHGLFVIEFTNYINNGSLQIYDMKGNRLDELRLDGSQWEIDLSLFSAGEYVLRIHTKDGKNYTRKIIKI